jgi:hypothetical protein
MISQSNKEAAIVPPEDSATTVDQIILLRSNTRDSNINDRRGSAYNGCNPNPR